MDSSASPNTLQCHGCIKRIREERVNQAIISNNGPQTLAVRLILLKRSVVFSVFMLGTIPILRNTLG